MTTIRRSERYRIFPTATQAARLLSWQDALRFLWNLALEQRLLGMNKPRCERRYISAYEQGRQLGDLRAELPWLADVSRNACEALLADLHTAWRRCFDRVSRPPRWKRKGVETCNIREAHSDQWHLDEGAVTFPKIGRIRAVVHRAPLAVLRSCTIVRDGDQWFACVMAEEERGDATANGMAPVALDRGIINLTADSNGRIVVNPRHMERSQQRLARAQRTVERRTKGSKNRERAKQVVARLHRKVRRQRGHLLHLESHHYANSHGSVIVEKLQIRNMVRSNLGRVIHDAGWGQLVRNLRYKCEWYGSRLVEVPAAYSSQTCAECGVVDRASRKSQSRFDCVACGHRAHADVNAAKVLLSRGSHGDAACGGLGEVGHPLKQEGRAGRLTSKPRAARLRSGGARLASERERGGK